MCACVYWLGRKWMNAQTLLKSEYTLRIVWRVRDGKSICGKRDAKQIYQENGVRCIFRSVSLSNALGESILVRWCTTQIYIAIHNFISISILQSVKKKHTTVFNIVIRFGARFFPSSFFYFHFFHLFSDSILQLRPLLLLLFALFFFVLQFFIHLIVLTET